MNEHSARLLTSRPGLAQWGRVPVELLVNTSPSAGPDYDVNLRSLCVEIAEPERGCPDIWKTRTQPRETAGDSRSRRSVVCRRGAEASDPRWLRAGAGLPTTTLRDRRSIWWKPLVRHGWGFTRGAGTGSQTYGHFVDGSRRRASGTKSVNQPTLYVNRAQYQGR